VSKRGVVGAAKALIDRVGLDAFAERVGVTERTAQRWLRDGFPPSRREDVHEALERSDRARRAAITRAENYRQQAIEEQRAAEAQAAARREAWATRRIINGREKILKERGLVYPNGETITGHTGRTHITLTQMLHRNDPAWREFLALAESNGRSERDAKNDWYSPPAKKKSKGKRKKNKGRKKSKGRRKRKK
jgi:hypothetical protein